MIRSEALACLPGFVHGLTTRDIGSVGPAHDPDALDTRRRVATQLGGDATRLVVPHQVHGAHVAVIGEDATAPGRADGVATAVRGVTLMVQGADCPLVAVVDVGASAFALVHSGWRGTVQHVARESVHALDGLGARAVRLRAAVFPGICASCFEVGPEVLRAFEDAFGAVARTWAAPVVQAGRTARAGHMMLDLPAAIVATLTDAGVSRERIDVVPGCTMCGDRLWSHRASGGAPERAGLFGRLGACAPDAGMRATVSGGQPPKPPS